MEIDYMMTWGAALLLLGLAIPLWMGKGAWLIAGYNTASKTEKAKYDEKKLCRVMAIVLMICDVFLILQIFSLISPIVTVVCVTVLSFVMILYMNIGCKKK